MLEEKESFWLFERIKREGWLFEEPATNEDFSAGQVVKLANGKMYLVGDVNENFGLCDCCRSFERRDVVGVLDLEKYLSR